MKKVLLGVILVLLFLMTGCQRHIKDTNGPDDYSLVSFSNDDKVSAKSYVAVGAISSHVLGRGSFSAKKFSGAMILYEVNVNDRISCYFDIEVESGNFEVILINDEQIIKSVALNNTSRFTIETSGKVTLKVIGESARFEIKYEVEHIEI